MIGGCLKHILSYMKLCRFDAAAIAFFSYLVGAELGGGVDIHDVFIAAAVTLISINFIYSFNSWADRALDQVDKPLRPIPSGKIRPGPAFVYSVALLILSVGYPFWVSRSGLTLFLFLMLPVLGLVYSAEPVRTRKRPFLSIVTICAGLVTPIMLGYFMHTADLSMSNVFLVLFLFCLSVVPLKQAEEVDVDHRAGYRNLYSKYGKNIIIWSLCGLSLVLLLTFVVNMKIFFKVQMVVFSLSAAGCILVYAFLKENLKPLYQRIIHIVIIEGVFFF